MCRLLFIISALAGYVPQLAAQATTNTPELKAASGVTIVEGRYRQAAGPYAALYNGAEHPDYDPRMIGSAYFGGNEWQTGSVYYDGVLFTQVPLKYDLVRGKLVVQHTNGFSKLELVNARLDSFGVDGHTFIHIRPTGVPGALAPGFYDRLVSGPITVLARRQKTIREYIEGMEVKREVNEKYDYYVLQNGVYHTIDKQRDLLNLFGDHRKEVLQQWRSAGVKFRRQKEASIVLAAQFYNQLNSR